VSPVGSYSVSPVGSYSVSPVILKLDILQAGRKITVLRERFRLHLPHMVITYYF
jgi:hypothetical protein